LAHKQKELHRHGANAPVIFGQLTVFIQYFNLGTNAALRRSKGGVIGPPRAPEQTE
jgi:hypothetical protein